MPRLAQPGDLPGRDIQRGEQGGGAVPDIIVGTFLRHERLHRQHRRGPVQGLDLRLLVHTKHYRVLRRCQVQPDDVGDLRDQFGVGGELERLRPPRLHPRFPPRLRIVLLLVFRCAASNRDDQWVIPSFFGGGVKVTEMIFDRSTSRGRPDRGSSINPSMPSASYRARHEVTVGRDTPTKSAIAVLLTPSAANKMILARCANPARIEDDRVHSDQPFLIPGSQRKGGYSHA